MGTTWGKLWLTVLSPQVNMLHGGLGHVHNYSLEQSGVARWRVVFLAQFAVRDPVVIFS